MGNRATRKLREAAVAGNYDRVKRYVRRGADVNAKDEYGRTALMIAVENDNVMLLQYLVKEANADLNAMDNRGTTVLMKVAENGNIDMVWFLVELGADVNFKNSHGSTALLVAMGCKNNELVLTLISLGADANIPDNYGRTALMIAVENGNVMMVQFLVETANADLYAMDKRERTVLMKVAEYGNIMMVQCVIELGADVNVVVDNYGRTLLIEAVEFFDMELVRSLVEEGDANLNATDKYGSTVVMIAMERGFAELVSYLTETGSVDVNAANENGRTVLTMAAEKGYMELVRHCIEMSDANANTTDEFGRSVLTWSADSGNIQLIRYLIEECGGDVAAMDKYGRTVLTWAVAKGKVEVVRFLVEECNADVNATSKDGKTAIQTAADHGHHEVYRILVLHLKCQKEVKNDPVSSRSWTISPEEVELKQFVDSSNVGGDYVAKWLDSDVVVKLFISDIAHSSFPEEVQLWQQLRHPNVIKLYGACQELQFFVCEFAENGSLVEYTMSPAAETQTILKYLYEAALGLEYLHERGIIHGDLRCRNILISSDGLSKLSNFGLSGSNGKASSTVGSMRWQAPEVLSGKRSSLKSDVYSLGMCILEAITKKKPWDQENDFWVNIYKKFWTPERKGGMFMEPLTNVDIVKDLVSSMCCQDPPKRVSLQSVVYELEQLALNLRSNLFQPECGQFYAEECWVDLTAYVKQRIINEYHLEFDELKKIHDQLQELSTPSNAVLTLFSALVRDYKALISLTPSEIRALHLSSTRATTNSMYSFYKRIESVWALLDQTPDESTQRAARWKEQRNRWFVSGVTDTFLLLKDLNTDAEKAAFLKMLKTEMSDFRSKYTPDQLDVMKKAVEVIERKVVEESLSNLVPEWFIPWYEIAKGTFLGDGGFGNVYQANWLNSEVVVKEVKLGGSDGSSHWSSPVSADAMSDIDHAARAQSLELFRKEVDIWFRFSHPHVIKLFGACHVGHPFFVSEYATNGTLVKYLKAHPDELWQKLYEAALGVQYLHARGVVHGDLKGNNIVVGSDKKAKVTDFGLSLLASDGGESQISAASHWVAPECFTASPRLTFASDVYSLGMCIVEAIRVVGGEQDNFPWKGLGNIAVRADAKKGILPPRPKQCKEGEWRLVKRMCTFQPTQRIKISVVVDAIARLANKIEEAQSVNTNPFPDVAADARAILATLDSSEDMVAMHEKLWDDLEKVNDRVRDKHTHGPGYRAFNTLVKNSKDATNKLQERRSTLISRFETKMRTYTLRRHLSKYLEAYLDFEQS